MGSLEEDGKGVSQALENQDFGSAAQNLDALFEARESNAVASDSYAPVSVPENSGASLQQVAYSDMGSLAGGTGGDFASEVPAPYSEPKPENNETAPFLATGAKEQAIGVGIGIIIDKVVEKIEKHVDRDQTKESEKKYHGCRPKGTC